MCICQHRAIHLRGYILKYENYATVKGEELVGDVIVDLAVCAQELGCVGTPYSPVSFDVKLKWL